MSQQILHAIFFGPSFRSPMNDGFHSDGEERRCTLSLESIPSLVAITAWKFSRVTFSMRIGDGLNVRSVYSALV
jgi:hypothetical protein